MDAPPDPRYTAAVNCVVTAGPTYEPLDEVRRLTNLSTGKLGSLLANFLVDRGHNVTLLLGQGATWQGRQQAQHLLHFTTTADLRARLQNLAALPVHALFHAAAVSDFSFGRIFDRSPAGQLQEIQSPKITSRGGPLLAELVPTPKMIGDLRGWFPQTRLVGWKYEVEGGRARVMALAKQQVTDNRTDACVTNGPAYGFGFGLLTADGNARHFSGTPELFAALETLVPSLPSAA